MNILMVSAENDALPGGKVGGIGDVVRDIAPALAGIGHKVMVATPGYQKFSRLPKAKHVDSVDIHFAGRPDRVEIYRVPAKKNVRGVELWIFEHPLFAAGGVGKIYCDDPADRPFATDATKFALFCAAVATATSKGKLGKIDALHLHDWHASMIAVLRAYDPAHHALKSIPTVFTIHNLALQGVRPFHGDESSLEAWFPHLQFDGTKINDPRAPHCLNCMRAGINLSDQVHAVSPSYALEILQPSDAAQGQFGGEGLEQDLQARANKGELHGILNGCEYPRAKKAKPSLTTLLKTCSEQLLGFVGKSATVDSSHFIAQRRLDQLLAGRKTPAPSLLLTSVGRITDQKALILRQPMQDGRFALEHLLDALDKKALFILLGSGDKDLEQFLTSVAGKYSNFLFIKGYSEDLSDLLYRCGDLFLMPSSFEPCGISQMLAMRVGQPCLVHAVGGLRDTVQHQVDGFAFSGDSLEEQASNMIVEFKAAQTGFLNEPAAWQNIQKKAAAARFTWKKAAEDYQLLLYPNG